MLKRLISMLLVAASLLLAGCANPRYQNVLEGGLIGGAIGALIGDSSRAARLGAGVGMLTGATLPIHSPAYGGQPIYNQPGAYPGSYPPPPPGISCRSGSVWDGRGCLRVGSGVPYPGAYPAPAPTPYGYSQAYPQGYPQMPQQGLVCGPAAMTMSCPSIQMPGGCRRCQ